MQGFLKINGIDAYTQWGITVVKGAYSRFLKPPSLKDNGLTDSFADENGDDEYLVSPKFDSLTVEIPIVMESTSENQFFARYHSFRNLLLAGGEMNWDLLKMGVAGKRFKLSYRAVSDYTIRTTIKGNDRIVAEMVLTLKNNYPTTDFTI